MTRCWSPFAGMQCGVEPDVVAYSAATSAVEKSKQPGGGLLAGGSYGLGAVAIKFTAAGCARDGAKQPDKSG